ncbi:MAG: family rane protein [Flaviaesturariibacter sp.]|nr:family rane protein [Flaviaesturariibacter sp.]
MDAAPCLPATRRSWGNGHKAFTARLPDRFAGGRRSGKLFLVLMKRKNMRSLLYIIAVVLIIGWLLGVFVYSATGLIHILIVLAVIALLLGIIRRA